MTDEFYSNDYVRRLFLESPYIKARLENPGGSVILRGTAASTEQPQDYSSQIGSSFHLDLLEAEIKFNELPEDQQKALLAWRDGVSAKEASMYFSAKGTVLRKRRERGVDSMAKKLNEDGQAGDDGRTGSGGRPDTPRVRDRYRRIS